MREIIFKGKVKDTDTGLWVEGGFYKDGDTTWIIQVEEGNFPSLKQWQVDPETVCQYTGLKDKNEKKIFEGDIIKIKFREGRVGSLEKEYNYVVRYDGSQASFEFEGHDELLGCPCLVQQNQHTFEVIGTIFDNPELLEVK